MVGPRSVKSARPVEPPGTYERTALPKAATGEAGTAAKGDIGHLGTISDDPGRSRSERSGTRSCGEAEPAEDSRRCEYLQTRHGTTLHVRPNRFWVAAMLGSPSIAELFLTQPVAK